MGIALGTRLGAYEVVGAIGSGGMGEVYRAVHSKLGREVAIKVLPPELAADETGLARFEREARTASALNHPSIVTIYDIDEHDSTTFIAMELVEGRTLREILSNGPLPIDRALHIARQLADGLAKAHEAGIVHRDMKPANVMVTEDGLAKILDFGLAKPLAAAGARDAIAVTLTRSGESTIAGTPRYMSPEQWTGETVDHRSDQFAFGVLLYEMLAGEPPFDGPTLGAVMTATLTRPAPPVRRSRADAPAELERIIGRCVEKDPAHRFDSTAEVVAALRACEESRARAAYGLLARLRRPAVAVPLAAVALATVAVAGLWVRGREARWAEREAIGEVERGIEAGDLFGAFRTYMAAAEHRPDDPELERVLARFTIPGVVNTDPPGAEVCVKDYATPGGECLRLGTTPLSLRLPYALLRWRITRDGYEPVEGAPFSPVAIEAYARGLVLDTPGGRPPGMVRVPGGAVTFIQGVRDRSRAGEPLAILGTYFLDRYEVTNGQFQEFVDRGGYGEAEWWPAPIGGDGQEVDRKAMMARLVDRTGRPGPATWELGRPPEGEAEHPVGGLSWYEAAAYCAFAGKSLPTIFHWFHAVGQLQTSDILGHSNVGGTEVAPVGQYRGLAGFGTYDMAGNVREWAWNATGGQRYNVSSAWNEPGYAFRFPRSEDPWSRDPANGVRCVRYIDDVPEALLGPVTPQLEYDRPEPIDTRGFELVRAMYAYERSGLDPRLERVDDSLPDWRRETVSFRTAYGDGRMEAHLLIPRDVEPPYQSVIWFPGGDVYALRTSETLSSSYLVDFLPRTGRVLVQPVFYGMYERFEPPPWDSPTAMRDLVVRWAQDVGRTIDYLETRPDFDASRIAYYGFSNGALFAPIFGAIEPRLGAMILLGGGLVPYPFRPESHPATFAPRARTPALLINGRDDFIVPYEVGQRPLFEMLGAPADSKRHALLEGGHMSDRSAIIREVLAFLDARFGRVSGVAER